MSLTQAHLQYDVAPGFQVVLRINNGVVTVLFSFDGHGEKAHEVGPFSTNVITRLIEVLGMVGADHGFLLRRDAGTTSPAQITQALVQGTLHIGRHGIPANPVPVHRDPFSDDYSPEGIGNQNGHSMDCSPGDCENCSGCHGLTGKEANMLLTGHRARAAILIRERMQAEAGERLSVTNLVRLMKDWIRANLWNRVLNDAASVREWVQEVRRQLNRE